MNLPSPFAASAEEHFTVREISMLLPPQFVRADAVAGSADQPVYLPADALRTSLQQGRPALRLSQIYLACPFLFNRPVQPSEDFEIALPFQKVKRIVEPGTAGAAGSPPLGNPFAAVAGPPAQVTVPPKRDSTPVSASPFLPAGEKAPAAPPAPSPSSPFPARTGGPQAPAGESPFGQRSAPPVGGNEVLSPFSSPPPAAERTPLPSAPANPFQRLDPPLSQLPLPPQPQSPPAAAPARAATSPFSLVAPGAPAAPPAPAPDTAPASAQKTTPMMFAPAAPAGEAPASPFAQKTPTGNSPPAQHLPVEPPPAPAPATTPAPAPAPVSQIDPLPVAPLKKTEPQPLMPYSPPPAAPQPPSHAQIQSLEAPRQVTGPVAPGHRMLRVSLSSLLRDVTAEDLGFDPSAVPSTVEVEISYDTILPQLATGRVEVGLEELRQGVVERFRPAFGRVRADLRFVVPLSEIFQNLPSSAIPAPQPAEPQHVPINTTPFQTPFAIKADEDKERLELPDLPRATTAAVPLTSSAQASLAASNAAAVSPFPVSAPPPAPPGPPVNLPPVNLPSRPPVSLGAGAPPPASDPQLPKLPGLPNLPKMPGMQGRPSPFSRPPGSPAPEPPQAPSLPQPPQAPVPHAPTPSGIPSLSAAEAHDDLGQPFSAASLRAEPPAPLKSPEPFDPSKLFSHDNQHAPKPAPAAPVPAPAPASPVLPALWKAAPPRAAAAAAAAPPAMEFNFGDTGNVSKSTLRALFMTDSDLSTEEVVEQCGGLPGLRACLVITSGGVVSSGINSSCEEVTNFTSQAPRAHEYLSGLAQSMGMEGAGSFTLRSAATVRTFFIERGLCLAVLHGQDRFEPGVRDKLMLTARTLADLLL